jgi:hypothetical protein
LPPVTLFTAQVTLVLLFPVTAAVNCSVCPSFTVAVVGLMVTVTVLDPPPHPQAQASMNRNTLDNGKRRVAISHHRFQPMVPIGSLIPLPVVSPLAF